MGARLLPRTLPDLLAYAIALEGEAARRLGELERFLRSRGAEHPANELARIGREEQEQLELIVLGTSGRQLPQFAGWELGWHFGGEPLGTDARAGSPREAIAMALAYERRTQAFYSDVADHAVDGAVRAFAADMAADEQRHVDRLELLLEREADSPPAEEAQARW